MTFKKDNITEKTFISITIRDFIIAIIFLVTLISGIIFGYADLIGTDKDTLKEVNEKVSKKTFDSTLQEIKHDIKDIKTILEKK